MEEQGKLYIVSTPIGNMEDITLRAIKILENIEYIACEDTRKTGLLLKKLDISGNKTLISYYEETEAKKLTNILNLLKAGVGVALVSDSGTPLVSDPGYPLARECIKNGIKVIPIPGATAVVAALTASGQPPDKFTFLGFLPRKEGNRLKMLRDVKSSNEKLESTIVIYEAPHRLVKTLGNIKNVFGNINITLTRELTKIHEEVINSNIDNLIEKFEKKDPRGEFVILFNLKS